MTNETQVIEVNGIKMEVDLRHARRVDTFRIGDRVKLLVLEDNSVCPGIVVGFEPFDSAPTIIVAYLRDRWGSVEIKTAFVNTKSTDKYELVASVDEHLAINKGDAVAKFNREIEKKEGELRDLIAQKDYFEQRFGSYFGREDGAREDVA